MLPMPMLKVTGPGGENSATPTGNPTVGQSSPAAAAQQQPDSSSYFQQLLASVQTIDLEEVTSLSTVMDVGLVGVFFRNGSIYLFLKGTCLPVNVYQINLYIHLLTNCCTYWDNKSRISIQSYIISAYKSNNVQYLLLNIKHTYFKNNVVHYKLDNKYNI